MAKDKKNNALIYAIIAVVVVVAIVIGVVVAVKKSGGDGDNDGQQGNSSLADYKNVDIEIEYGDFDGMTTLAKDIQNGLATGKVVKIDGIVSHPLSSYNIVVPNTEGTERIGTQFVIDGDGTYPEDGAHVVITGKVIETSPLYFMIQTLPELIEVQE